MITFLLKELRAEIYKMQEKIVERKMTEILKNTFYRAFKYIDREFYDRNNEGSKKCGACTSSVLIIGNMLYCANVGDCRTILCRSGRAVNMSVDHRASLPSEVERVEKLGGYIN